MSSSQQECEDQKNYQALSCIVYYNLKDNVEFLLLGGIIILLATFIPRIIVRFIFFIAKKIKYVRVLVTDFETHCANSTAYLVSASLVWTALAVTKLNLYIALVPLYLWGLFFLPWLYSIFSVVQCVALRRFGGSEEVSSKIIVITESIKLLRLVLLVIVAAIIYLRLFGSYQNILLYSIFGMVGLSVALGSVGAIHNAIGGLYLVFHAPFKVEDFIEIDGNRGSVTRVALRYTMLATLDGTSTFIPNKFFLIKPMVNLSQRPKRQLDITLELVHDTSVALIRRFIVEAEDMLMHLHSGLTSHRLNFVDCPTDKPGVTSTEDIPSRFFFVAMTELYKVRVYSYTEELDPKKHALIKSEVWLALAEIMEDLGIQQRPTTYASSISHEDAARPFKSSYIEDETTNPRFGLYFN